MTTLIPKYDQGSTGAVNRPINLKLAETVSVKDFGAVGNGTTDDTDAIEAAWDSGYNLYFPLGAYKVTRSLNFTNATGRTITGANNYATGVSVILGTSAIGNYPVMDLSQSNGIIIKNLSIQCFSTDTCFIGILLARVGSTSSGTHTLENVNIYGKFSNSALYTSSSEENTYYTLEAESLSDGARAVTIIDVPESNVRSAYVDITNPSGGNTVHRFYSGRFINLTSNNSNRCFYIKTARHVLLDGIYMNPGSIATYAIEVTTSSALSLHSITCEGGQSNVIGFNGANSNIAIICCVLPEAITATIFGAVGSTITDLELNTTLESPLAISCPALYNSTIHCTNAGVEVTASYGNRYLNIYRPADITLTASSGDILQIGTAGVTANVGVVSNNFATEIAMTSGAFNDIDRKLANMVVATGTTGALTISGFTKGYYGQELLFVHNSAYALTLKNLSLSASENQIQTNTNADVTLGANTNSCVKFVYYGGVWVQI